MKKKKSVNSAIFYIMLVFLIVLLLMPPVFRLFGKKWYSDDNNKKDVIDILSCNKPDERINSTFLNNIPQNIDYRIKGNYLEDNELIAEQSNNQVIQLIRPFAEISYDVDEDMTVFKVVTQNMRETKEYMGAFSTILNQQNYYSALAFTCQKTTY